LENFKELLSTDNQRENIQWRPSIKKEEKVPLTSRLVHIPYNLLSPSSLEQLNNPKGSCKSC